MKNRYVTLAGRTILIRESASTCAGGKGKKRRPKENVTPEAVAKVNRTNRERELTAKLNHNFVPGDLWITLTYENDPSFGEGLSREDCMRQYRNFRKNIQRWAKKNDHVLKMIDSFGYGERLGRPHHHIVMSDAPTELLTRYWKSGRVHIEVLHGYNYQRIAKYMLKNAELSKDGKLQRTFNCTRNIVTPQTRRQVMKSNEITRDIEDIKPFTGYQIDRDSVNKYEHPIFEIECIEYIMVSLEPEPRLSRWSKGRKIREEKQYAAAWPQQLYFAEETVDEAQRL